MTALDEGLLSPVTAGHDADVADAAVLDALVAAEVALARAWERIGIAPPGAVAAISGALGWQGVGRGCRGHAVALPALVDASVAGGNPVIPLVGRLKQSVPADARVWVHRGPTSQDILDSALMLVARTAVATIMRSLADLDEALSAFAAAQRGHVAAARTLTQHGVPTTVGLRSSLWLRGVRRSVSRLQELTFPAQLGGAGGTLASFVELTGLLPAADGQALGATARTRALVEAYAAELALDAPEAPWHVTRWPVTELGDALVQAIDAVGKIATDVATLSRTEIGELSEGSGGGSSAMPQKQNPAASVLLRSAAIRAPQLSATLHLASALAGDERPDGAWHAEWPTLRELLRLALGTAAGAAGLVAGLRVDAGAVAANLSLTRGLIVAERLSVVLGPVLGKDEVGRIVADVAGGADITSAVSAALQSAGVDRGGLDVDALVDPANYTGLAAALVDAAVPVSPPSPENEWKGTPS